MKYQRYLIISTLMLIPISGITVAASNQVPDNVKFLKTFFGSTKDIFHTEGNQLSFNLFEKIAENKSTEITAANTTEMTVIEELEKYAKNLTVNMPKESQNNINFDYGTKEFTLDKNLQAGEYIIPYHVCADVSTKLNEPKISYGIEL